MTATLTRRGFLIAAGAAGAIACNRPRRRSTEPSANQTPAEAAPPSPPRTALLPWEPIDEMFRACEGGCGARVAGASAGVVVQPGAQLGQGTYCPVSGVVFTVTDASPREEVNGRPIYVCCAACAQYFAANRDRIIALRRLGS